MTSTLKSKIQNIIEITKNLNDEISKIKPIDQSLIDNSTTTLETIFRYLADYVNKVNNINEATVPEKDSVNFSLDLSSIDTIIPILTNLNLFANSYNDSTSKITNYFNSLKPLFPIDTSGLSSDIITICNELNTSFTNIDNSFKTLKLINDPLKSTIKDYNNNITSLLISIPKLKEDLSLFKTNVCDPLSNKVNNQPVKTMVVIAAIGPPLNIPAITGPNPAYTNYGYTLVQDATIIKTQLPTNMNKTDEIKKNIIKLGDVNVTLNNINGDTTQFITYINDLKTNADKLISLPLDTSDNTMTYVIGGTVGVAAIGGIAYYFLNQSATASVPKGGYFNIGD